MEQYHNFLIMDKTLWSQGSLIDSQSTKNNKKASISSIFNPNKCPIVSETSPSSLFNISSLKMEDTIQSEVACKLFVKLHFKNQIKKFSFIIFIFLFIFHLIYMQKKRIISKLSSAKFIIYKKKVKLYKIIFWEYKKMIFEKTSEELSAWKSEMRDYEKGKRTKKPFGNSVPYTSHVTHQ